MYKQQVLVNDTLNLLRGKSQRFILEDGDLRMIANLVAVVDELGLEYDPEGMVYRHPKETQIRAQINEERDRAIWEKLKNKLPEPEDDFWSYDEDAPEPEPEEEPDDEFQEAFEHAWDRELRKDLKDAKSSHTNIPRAQLAKELELGAEYAQYDPSLSPEEREKKAAEAARLERNRKAREKYHAKKGKVNVRKRKTKGRK
tara:strand:- start:1342 stop:1941 length:600 start_codon:yes stop_codon:yes gene_type:complete